MKNIITYTVCTKILLTSTGIGVVVVVVDLLVVAVAEDVVAGGSLEGQELWANVVPTVL